MEPNIIDAIATELAKMARGTDLRRDADIPPEWWRFMIPISKDGAASPLVYCFFDRICIEVYDADDGCRFLTFEYYDPDLIPKLEQVFAALWALDPIASFYAEREQWEERWTSTQS